ncbi:sugar-binding transcriptional regulator [Marinivivus vitaminiproducens]|uniref:sugar-binding transcriptional regulator n=1 Tax=Marinivivus vitaminiproducens TaxID=3035935 RepID=UPI00279DBCAC|nr:sugar-binding transcriptional regulator [Geminicoccaceae bacterium SCSIO 64248]
MDHDERGLASRAAWLSYIGGLTQEDIAQRLKISRIKVNRLIAAAHQAGIIRVFVEGDIAPCLTLESALTSRFGLSFCRVAPDLGEDDLPLKTLTSAGAHYLNGELDRLGAGTIGIGHGRTLAGLVDRLPRIKRPRLKCVSLLGSLTRKSAANPHDVIHQLAELTGGEGYFMPAPLFVDSLEDKRVVMGQKSLLHVLRLASEAQIYVIGIGEVGPDAQLIHSGMITHGEAEALVAAGAVGEILGCYFDADGRPIDAEINRRAIHVALDALAGKEVVAIAGGPAKVEAIDAVLRSGLFTGLITDERTAARLAKDDVRRKPDRHQDGRDTAA